MYEDRQYKVQCPKLYYNINCKFEMKSHWNSFNLQINMIHSSLFHRTKINKTTFTINFPSKYVRRFCHFFYEYFHKFKVKFDALKSSEVKCIFKI